LRTVTLLSTLFFSGAAFCQQGGTAEGPLQTVALPFCMVAKLNIADMIPAIQPLKSPPTLTATTGRESIPCPDGFRSMRISMTYAPGDYTPDAAQLALEQAKHALEETRPTPHRAASAPQD
jgi:hypothetical protein